MTNSERPWGHYEILYDGKDCKVKLITVKPGHRLSYQYHFERDELWKVISGKGMVTLNGSEIPVLEGSVIHICKFVKHRVKNTGSDDLVFVEIQVGSYFGEDDIVRLEDDYERT